MEVKILLVFKKYMIFGPFLWFNSFFSFVGEVYFYLKVYSLELYFDESTSVFGWGTTPYFDLLLINSVSFSMILWNENELSFNFN